MTRRITTLIAATALATGMMSGTAFADPAPVPGPPTHEHTLTTPGNRNVVKIGPTACRVEQADRGARNLHLRVHSFGPPPDHNDPVAPVDPDRENLEIGFVRCPPQG